MTTPFLVPFVAPNPDSWGPPGPGADEGNPNAPPSSGKFLELPYAPFGRSDRLGRAADFTNLSRGDRSRFNRQGRYDKNDRNNDRRNNKNNEDSDVEDETFQLVDTSKATTTKRFVPPAAKRRQHTARLRQVNARRQQQGGTAFPLSKQEGFGGRGRGGAGARGGRGGRGGRGRGRGRGRGYNNNRIDRQPSVSVQPDWVKVEELDLAKVTKNLAGAITADSKKSKKALEESIPKPQDVLWCGFLDQYNEMYDKITARQPVPLKRMATKEFYPVTTTDDPVLEKLAVDGIGGAGDGDKRSVFVTDNILAHLMTCSRSVYPWDLVIQKTAGGLLFLDKRDNSQLDYLTVWETSYNAPPPSKEGEDSSSNINTPERLGLEATTINQNFSQQILKKSGRKDMDLPNPFFDEDDADGMEPASVAYRYRKFELDPNTTLVCRTELHGLVKKTQYMTAFSLNEYNPPPVNGVPSQTQTWRDRIDSQRGSVLANELKNNSFKLAKWTAQSLLAGADQMKIGFCSRSNPKSAYDHVILATQFYRPKDFASQITLSETQMWAMIRMFVTMFAKQEEGKYVLMREPNKAVLTMYKVPQETFEEDE